MYPPVSLIPAGCQENHEAAGALRSDACRGGQEMLSGLLVANPLIGPEEDKENAARGRGLCGAGILEIGSVVW